MRTDTSITVSGSLGIAYPERDLPREAWYETRVRELLGALKRPLLAKASRFASIVALVERNAAGLGAISDPQLRSRAQALGRRMRREGFEPGLVAATFALVREAAERHVGQRHFDVQLIGGWVLLRGMIAEMDTGEGKTLTATLAAATAALAGVPVHVITVNDYLATRDARAMAPIYAALGLTVGVVDHELDAARRHDAYASHVTYCSNKEIAFDFLRDRIALNKRHRRLSVKLERLRPAGTPVSRLLLRGLYFAIVDEADSVLIDEARTPLIISEGARESQTAAFYQQAITIAARLDAGGDFRLDPRERRIELTREGLDRLEQMAGELDVVWQGPRRREQLITQALSALHLHQRDVHYLVRDDKAQIIDEYTGRILADRSWEQGLHQMVEAKEGLPITERRESLARTSYQRFFRRYLHLAGMTGTAWEVAPELRSVYSLDVVRIPPNRPIRRQPQCTRVFRTQAEKWQAVVERVAEIHAQGRPVLVGTRSVEASERASGVLGRHGLAHSILNASQDRHEADVISGAGQPGAVTVATNMAGRGTDIVLDPGVTRVGGLHVMATEIHDARRIDRQLFGRCGRQGDPGTYEMFLSLEDELIVRYLPRHVRSAAGALLRFHRAMPAVGILLRIAQLRAERHHFQARKRLLKLDEHIEESLAFSGSGRTG